MSASADIRTVLAAASEPLTVEEINAQIGREPQEEAATSALLTYLAKRGEARNVAGASKNGQWVSGTEIATPKKRGRPAAVVTQPIKAAVAAPVITPPGSMAIADDGSVLLIDGDRIVNRLTAEQVRNVAALAARFQS